MSYLAFHHKLTDEMREWLRKNHQETGCAEYLTNFVLRNIDAWVAERDKAIAMQGRREAVSGQSMGLRG